MVTVKDRTKERWRLALQLRFSGKTYKEMAKALGVSPARARVIFMRAQKNECEARAAKLFIDWRVSYDYRILVDIIDDIRGLAKNERQS